jgi:hypothetical protein
VLFVYDRIKITIDDVQCNRYQLPVISIVKRYAGRNQTDYCVIQINKTK